MAAGYREFLKNHPDLYSKSESRVQIQYLTKIHIEHILLQEIKKWEPYIEEEKNEIRLNFIED
jgi:hypothetical protein